VPSGPLIEFTRPPAPLRYMAGAFRPGRRPGPFPELRAVWRGYRATPGDRAALAARVGLDGAGLDLLEPHVLGFRALMAVLTQPSFPLPIWRALQIRNHLLLRCPLPAGQAGDLEVVVVGQRVLDKGAEVDLHTALRAGGEVVWESLNTFYYRGRHGPAGPPSPLSAAPEVVGGEVATWTAARGAGWSVGGLTGDYNPVHWSAWYARRQRFRGAFLHPQLVLGRCLALLPPPGAGEGQRLDAWLRGPVYQGATTRLRAERRGGGSAFALEVEGDPRPAILGTWRAAAPGESLLASADPGR